MKTHPIFKTMFSEMGHLGLLPAQEREMDRELELEGICALPEMEIPESFPEQEKP